MALSLIFASKVKADCPCFLSTYRNNYNRENLQSCLGRIVRNIANLLNQEMLDAHGHVIVWLCCAMQSCRFLIKSQIATSKKGQS